MSCTKGYFTYLHDTNLSWQAYCKANYTVVNDLYRLLNQGIVFNRLADIFHTIETAHESRADGGRYYTLSNLLKFLPYGNGRLTGWLKAVEYVNLREGLADLGDWKSLADYFQGKDLSFIETSMKYDMSDAGKYIFANIIAEYQLVLQLVAGRRGRLLTEKLIAENKSSGEIQNIWLKLAELMLYNCAQAIAIITQTSEDIAKRFLEQWIDTNRYAKQMEYWMTNHYINDIVHNDIPRDIYGKDTKVCVQNDNFMEGTFNINVGCSINSVDPDLGPVNGQEPIKEGNKLFYGMVIFIMTVFKQQSDNTKSIREILNESTSFAIKYYLDLAMQPQQSKFYHQLMINIYSELIGQKKISSNDTKFANDRMIHHIHEKSARLIQRIWRARANKKERDLLTYQGSVQDKNLNDNDIKSCIIC